MPLATGQITIMDLNDSVTLQGFLVPDQSTAQYLSFNGTTSTYNIDWTANNMVLTAEVYKIGSAVDIMTSTAPLDLTLGNANGYGIMAVRWYYMLTGETAWNTITSGAGGFTLSADKEALTIAQNKMTATNPGMTIKVEIDYKHSPALDAMTFQMDKTFILNAQGAAGVSAVLSNDAASFAAALDGTVSSFTGGATTMKVYYGATDDSANYNFTAASSHAGITYTGGGTASIAVNGFSIAAGDTGYIDITATHKTTSAVVVKRFTVSKSKTGATGSTGSAGVNAKTLNLSTTSDAFSTAQNGTVTPDWIQITAKKQNTANGVTWGTSPTVALYTASTGGTLITQGTTTADTVYMRKADFGAQVNTVVTATIAGDSLTDTVTIYSAKSGIAALLPVISNPTFSMAANSAGTISDYTGSGTTIKVYEGSTALNYVTSGPVAGQFTIGTATKVGTVTVGGYSGTGTPTATVAVHSAMTTDAAVITYPLTIVRANGTTETISVTQALNKIKPGYDSVSYWQSANTDAIVLLKTGALLPSTISVTAYSQTGSATPAAYAGRFKIYESTDGTNFGAAVYTSSANETTKSAYDPTTSNLTLKAIKIELYLAGGTTTLLDSQVIPVVSDGLDPVTCDLWAPDGSIFKKTPGSTPANLTAQMDVYEGATLLSSGVTYKWFTQDPLIDDTGDVGYDADAGLGWKTISGATAKTYSVASSIVPSYEVFKCIASYDPAVGAAVKLSKTIEFFDQTDPYVLEFHSTSGDRFSNGVGSTVITAKVLQNGTYVDLTGEDLVYSWTQNDKTGALIPTWYAVPTAYKTVAMVGNTCTASAGSSITVTDGTKFTVGKYYKFGTQARRVTVIATNTLTVDSAVTAITGGTAVYAGNYKGITVTAAEVDEKGIFFCDIS